jgi:hypothetical protein
VALRWLAAVRTYSDWPFPFHLPVPEGVEPGKSRRPLNGKMPVIAVAAVMAGHARKDGSNSRPSIETIMAEAGASQRTARLALALLVKVGWLKITAEAIPWHAPTVYRLAFLWDAQGHPMNEPRRDAQGHPMNEPRRDAPRDAQRDAHGHPDLRSPSKYEEEEEESAGARSFSDSLAALSHDRVPVGLFTNDDHGQGDLSLRGSSVDEIADTQEVAIAVARRARMDLDPGRSGLAGEMVAAKARAGWADADLIAYCADKLRRAKPKDPTAWLATDLRTRVTASTILPVVGLRAEYAELLHRVNESSPGEDDDPIILFEDLLTEADLLDAEKGANDRDMPDEHLEQAIKLAKQVLAKAKAGSS